MAPSFRLPSPALALLLLGLGLCAPPAPTQSAPADPGAVWKQGKAEVSRYALSQGRYRENHEGDAVLIFVVEPFSRTKHVKVDDWQAAGDDLVHVLKLNQTRHFNTGLYPYSLMLSTFTPFDTETPQPLLKITTSVQEWCGHAFTQINRREDRLDVTGFSYFESEGDRKERVRPVMTEDEIWTRVRLTPDKLPTGTLELLPGTFYARLAHKPLRPEPATAEQIRPEPEAFDPAKVRGYRISYTGGIDRVLTLWFEIAAPHGIVGWEESYTDVAGIRLTTRAKRTHAKWIDYWTRNANADRALRPELGLPADR
jgi:hypothetical protein